MSTHLALQSDFESRLFQLELAEKLLAHSFSNRAASLQCAGSSALSFGTGAAQKLAEKALGLDHLGPSCGL